MIWISTSITTYLEEFARGLGADVFGAANLELFKRYLGMNTSLLDFPFGLSVGIRLSDAILNRITSEDPTPEYARHYRAVNALLDSLAVRIASRIQEKGYDALPIPASQTTRPDLHLGAISHKAIAAIAGLGWIGKSQLLITPEYGPRIRLASVLTTVSSKTGKPMENRCGKCEACADACPVRAIRPTEPGAQWVREDVFDPEACHQRLVGYERNPIYGSSVCGMCIKACPVGRRSKVE